MTIYYGGVMTAALFDVKAKFSEYVTMAEKGEVVEITKHGKTSAVIISIQEYNRLKKDVRPGFIDQLNNWRRRTGGLTAEEYSDFENAVVRNKENYSQKGSLF